MKYTLSLLSLLLFVVGSLFSGGNQEGGEIVLQWPTIWVGQDSKAETVATIVDEFNQNNAGRIRVVIEPNPDYDGYRDKINASIAAGQVPDLFVFNPDPTTFQYYESDLLFDFTDELAGAWGDSFVSGTIEASTRYGYTKSIPYEIAVTPIWYNQDLFDQAGVDRFPRTIDEFWEAGDKLKAAGISPTSQMTGGSNAWTSMLWFSHILASIGGPDVWEKPLSDPQYIQAAAIIQRMFREYSTRDAVGADAGVSGGHYLAGRTAMFINGPWYIGRIRGDAPDVYEATRLAPAPQVGRSHGHQIGFSVSNLAAAHTEDPARRAAVIEFMKWMTLPENVSRISTAAGAMFAVKFEADDVDPLQAQFIEASSNALFITSHFQGNYPVSVVNELGQNFGALALGEITPEEFVANLQELNN